MVMKWLPWKYVVRRVARARGFIDPISVLSRLHRFAEPSEVAAPLELLRAGVVFHARGLMNSGAIQHNMDWIWPFWIERQFNPRDVAFIPRGFSITHVNLTHRNWTAVGLPNHDQLPIVDPRGLLTPFWDGWSIDGWIFRKDGVRLIPSRLRSVDQHLEMQDGLAVVTNCESHGLHLHSKVEVVPDETNDAIVRQVWTAGSNEPAWLVISLRPYNPEGVSFIHDIDFDQNAGAWTIGKHGHVYFSQQADQHFTSDYKHGDVSALGWTEGSRSVSCHVGMATAAALFALSPGDETQVELTIPLDEKHHRHWLSSPRENSMLKSQARLRTAQPQHDAHSSKPEAGIWSHELRNVAKLDVPDHRFRELHDAAIRTLVLHTPDEVYPGPFTYKRFWIRDAVFMLHAALCVGMHDRVKRALPHLLKRQTSRGYFYSQDGEWDSNGQVLWLLERICELSHQDPPEQWKRAIQSATNWIQRKRTPTTSNKPTSGLLPAGFSAEHLGPNDHYYWDDFWSVAGLQSAARMMHLLKDDESAMQMKQESQSLMDAINRSLEQTDYLRGSPAFPAAPERRMDAGAIGSIVASFPLQLVSPQHERLRGTLRFLRENCMVEGGFFQDMIHSGINPYLTLHIAQAMLRQGDGEWFDLLNVVSDAATSTGQWPEAIHPQTMGGCMGDGQHAWAAAEWLMAIRNMFVREEGDTLIIGSGIPAHWHYADQVLSYGPTWTKWGELSLKMHAAVDQIRVKWQANWHRKPHLVRIDIPGCDQLDVDMSAPKGRVVIQSSHSCAQQSV